MRELAFAVVLALGSGIVHAMPQQTSLVQDSGDASSPISVEAPSDEAQSETPTPPHTGIRALFRGVIDDLQHLPNKTNLYVLAGGGLVAIAAHPFDQTFNVRLRSHYTAVNQVYAPAKYVGGTPAQIGLSLATYAYGRIFDQPKVSHLGMDLLRAQILTEIMVEPLKLATQRQRPDGSNALSFPSGHAAITFAVATVLERHLGWKKAVLGYLLASYVASSRLHDNRHYLSDVAFGAAIGTVSGLTITQHGASNWTVAPVSVPGGVAVLATVHPQ